MGAFTDIQDAIADQSGDFSVGYNLSNSDPFEKVPGYESQTLPQGLQSYYKTLGYQVAFKGQIITVRGIQ